MAVTERYRLMHYANKHAAVPAPKNRPCIALFTGVLTASPGYERKAITCDFVSDVTVGHSL